MKMKRVYLIALLVNVFSMRCMEQAVAAPGLMAVSTDDMKRLHQQVAGRQVAKEFLEIFAERAALIARVTAVYCEAAVADSIAMRCDLAQQFEEIAETHFDFLRLHVLAMHYPAHELKLIIKSYLDELSAGLAYEHLGLDKLPAAKSMEYVLLAERAMYLQLMNLLREDSFYSAIAQGQAAAMAALEDHYTQWYQTAADISALYTYFFFSALPHRAISLKVEKGYDIIPTYQRLGAICGRMLAKGLIPDSREQISTHIVILLESTWTRQLPFLTAPCECLLAFYKGCSDSFQDSLKKERCEHLTNVKLEAILAFLSAATQKLEEIAATDPSHIKHGNHIQCSTILRVTPSFIGWVLTTDLLADVPVPLEQMLRMFEVMEPAIGIMEKFLKKQFPGFS